MSTAGSTPAAWAWRNWALLISWPEGATAEFSAMF